MYARVYFSASYFAPAFWASHGRSVGQVERVDVMDEPQAYLELEVIEADTLAQALQEVAILAGIDAGRDSVDLRRLQAILELSDAREL